MENSNIIYRINEWLKTSVMFKLFIIATLIILLLIPSFMIQSLINERTGRRDEVRNQVAQSWGDDQIIAGPLLKVPFHYTELTAENEEVQRIRNYYITPVNLQIDAVTAYEERVRSIYRIPVYEASCQLKGQFELGRVMQNLHQKGTRD
jgi:inner membrane protein